MTARKVVAKIGHLAAGKSTNSDYLNWWDEWAVIGRDSEINRRNEVIRLRDAQSLD